MRKSTLLLASAGLLAISCAATATECRYSAPRNAEIDAAGLKTLAVVIGPDELNIHSDPAATRIVVQGTACASSPERLKDLAIATARHGDAASVVAHDGDHGVHIVFFSASYAYLKLDVSVPQSLAVKLQEGSGDAQASKLAALDAVVGSGDLKVHGIAGQLALQVGSGDVEARDVGSLNVSAVASGDASVAGVHGDVQVGSVGSGDFAASDVKGNATLGGLSSGDAKLTSVGGNVEVKSVGSGDFGATGVTGNVSIGALASGDVRLGQIGGNVHVASVGSGDFNVNGVAGDFTVDAIGSGDVGHTGVKGKVSLPKTDD